MTIAIVAQQSAPSPTIDVSHLKGTSQRPTELVLEHSNNDLEGFE